MQPGSRIKPVRLGEISTKKISTKMIPRLNEVSTLGAYTSHLQSSDLSGECQLYPMSPTQQKRAQNMRNLVLNPTVSYQAPARKMVASTERRNGQLHQSMQHFNKSSVSPQASFS